MESLKIKNYKKFEHSVRPQIFELVFSKETKGELEVSFMLKEFRVKVDKDLSSKMRLQLIIEIFNKFCISKKRFKLEYQNVLNKRKLSVVDKMEPLEEYKLVINDEEKECALSLIDEIMKEYSITNFNINDKKQKIIYYMKYTYETLSVCEKQSGKIDFLPLKNLNDYERAVCFNLITRYCYNNLELNGSFEILDNSFNFSPISK